MDRWVGGWVGRWMSGWIDRWMDGWTGLVVKDRKFRDRVVSWVR